MDTSELGNRIRRLRTWRGQTQEELAGFTGRTARWLREVEAGHSVPDVEDIARIAFGLRLEEAVVMGFAPMPRAATEDDVNRREFIHATAALALTPALVVGVPDRAVRQLEQLEQMTGEYARLSRTMSPALLFGPVRGHLETFRGALHGSGRRTYVAAAEAAILVGRLAQYLNLWGESHQALSWAHALAREAGDPALAAHALGAMSGLHSAIPRGGWSGDPRKAVQLLDAAIRVGRQAAPAPMLAWLYARRAEERASLGNGRGARSDLDQAGLTLDPDEGFFRHISDPWLAGYRGNVERLLGRAAPAIEAFDAALAALPEAQTGSRSGVLADLAATRAMRGDVDGACASLGLALDLADESGVQVANDRIAGVRRRELGRHTDAAAVRRLDERLQA